MLYSASQLLGKTMLLNSDTKVYKLSDVNALGDKAKAAFTMPEGKSFIVSSYLAPTAGYTSDYHIKYAKRSDPYFTFQDAGEWYAVAIIGDGRFSLKALRAQGALTVKEEAEARERENKSEWDKLKDGFNNIFGNIPGTIKTIIIVAIVIVVLSFIFPVVFRNLKKVKP